jgi:hypothetical protein
MVRALLASLVVFAGSAAAQEKASPPADVKKTVDALVGKWTLASQATMPGVAEPVKFTMTVDCKAIALGNALDCAFSAKPAPAVLQVAQSCYVAYDAAASNVRAVCMTPSGEVRDRRGAWKDERTLDFGPFKHTIDGKAATETVNLSWADPKTLGFSAVTLLEDGTKLAVEGRGKRK